jgi:hypothetical protein
MEPIDNKQLFMPKQPFDEALQTLSQPELDTLDIFAAIRVLGGKVISAGVYVAPPLEADRPPRFTVDAWILLDGKENPQRYGFKVEWQEGQKPVHILCKIGEMNIKFLWDGNPPTSFHYDSPLAHKLLNS